MSTPLPPWQADRPPPVPVRRFTVDEYHRLGEVGVLTEDDRVELLEGWIVPKMVHNPPHDNAIELADEALRSLIPSGWRLRIQSCITTADSEPEPDLAIVRGSARKRRSRHPEAAEVALVIEVADWSIDTDRTTKARLYARAGIPAYWIVNLVAGQLEVHREPSAPGADPPYQRVEILGSDATVPVVIDGGTVGRVPVASLLP